MRDGARALLILVSAPCAAGLAAPHAATGVQIAAAAVYVCALAALAPWEGR